MAHIEFVRWLDSGTHLSDGWMSLDIVRQQAPASLQVVETVGHVIHEDDEVLVLGLSIDEANATVFGAQVIAKPCIRGRSRVNLVEEAA